MVKTTIDSPKRSQPHRSYKQNDTKPDCNSSIGQHLLKNEQCVLNYDNRRFSILATARSSYHLDFLEATYIKTTDRNSLLTLSNCFDILLRSCLVFCCAYTSILLWRNLLQQRTLSFDINFIQSWSMTSFRHFILTRGGLSASGNWF